MANDFSYEVTEEIGIIGNPTPSGWTTQLNLVSWNGKEPKLDIRSWNEDRSRMGKGIENSSKESPLTFLGDGSLTLGDGNPSYDVYKRDGLYVVERVR